MLYVKLRKAMYGCMRAARLWWKDLSTYLVEELGFQINPYDSCVVNKTIDGEQCTIIWHVDDLKISHKSKEVVENIIKKIEEKYGEMSVNISDKHTYLGMDFHYKKDKTVVVSMIGYIEQAINEFPEKYNEKVKTPAGPHLFEVNENEDRLDDEKEGIFHRIVAMLLFFSKRARPDIHVPIAFLSTRTTKSDSDDWKKLGRLIGYLKGTLHLKLHLSCADGISVIKWWVDASYGIHHDMKSHSGAVMTLGNGAVYS